jgi:sec-independent protein translocase protein TatA
LEDYKKVFGLGPLELTVILVIVILIFGVGKLPELGTGLGEGIKNFKKSYRDAKTIDVTPEGEDQPASKTKEKTSSSSD